VKVAYLFAERDSPVLRPTGHSVHIQEMCHALAGRGHEVVVLAGTSGADRFPAPESWRIHELASGPRTLPLLRRSRRGLRGQRRSGRQPARRSWGLRAIGLDAARIPWWRAWGEYFYRSALPILERERPDFIYERYVLGSSVGARLSRALDLPLILEVNTSFTFPEEWWEPHSPLYPLAVRRLEDKITARAARVVVVSSRIREYLLSRGLPDDKIVTMPNGADVDRFRPDEAAAARVRARYGLESGLVIGFIGSLKPWHGVELLLDSASTVFDEVPDGRLLIVGDGPLRAALQQAAAERGIGARVVFTGYVARDEAPAHIAGMDIAVAPYPRLADFHFSPIKVFEYMAAGKPVVVSSYPDIAAVVEDRRNGMLTEPGDTASMAAAIVELAGDRQLRDRLGEEARRTVAEHHTWRHNAAEVVRLAQEALVARQFRGRGPAVGAP
jgi:glycosyltransferase involved in cell wall biosynthesis